MSRTPREAVGAERRRIAAVGDEAVRYLLGGRQDCQKSGPLSERRMKKLLTALPLLLLVTSCATAPAAYDGGGGTYVRILGAVQRPGLWTWTDEMTIEDAVAKCGGLTKFAYRGCVERNGAVVHQTRVNRGTRPPTLDDGNFLLEPGDSVYIDGPG
jgi:hypothetical protein